MDPPLQLFASRIKEIESCFESVTARLFNFVVINDSGGFQSLNDMVDSDTLKKQIADIILMEKPSLNKKKSKWVNSPIFKEPERVTFSNATNEKPVEILEKYRCQTCDLPLCNFQHYFFHVFGFAHSVKKKNFIYNSTKSLSTDPWENLLEYAHQNGYKLSEIKFSNYRRENDQYEVLLEVFGQEFRQIGTTFKDMRLSVIESALKFAENNLSKPLRKVIIPYIKGVERAAVVIDNITEPFVEAPPRPANNDPTIPIETVVMSFIDYMATQIANEGRQRYLQFFKEVFNKVHTTDRGAYCDLCKNRFSAANVVSHLCMFSHFQKTLDLPRFRHLKEISLITGKDVKDVTGPSDPHRVYRRWIFHFRAPETLLSLEGKYYMYYCAFCDTRLKTDYALEVHNNSESHKLMLKTLCVKDERSNIEKIRDRINYLLIPEEYRDERCSSVTELPEQVRLRFFIEPMTIDMVRNEIQKLDSNVKGAVEKLREKLEKRRVPSVTVGGGRKNRKRNRKAKQSLAAASKPLVSDPKRQSPPKLARTTQRTVRPLLQAKNTFKFNNRFPNLYGASRIRPPPLLNRTPMPLLPTPKPYAFARPPYNRFSPFEEMAMYANTFNRSISYDPVHNQYRNVRGRQHGEFDSFDDAPYPHEIERKRAFSPAFEEYRPPITKHIRPSDYPDNQPPSSSNFLRIKIDYGFGLRGGPVSVHDDNTPGYSGYNRSYSPHSYRRSPERDYEHTSGDSMQNYRLPRSHFSDRRESYGYRDTIDYHHDAYGRTY